MPTPSIPARSPRGASIAAAAAGLVAAVPVVAWWLTGQQDVDGIPPAELDYAVRPLSLGPGLERALGVISLLVALGSLAFLLHASRRERFDPRWWQVVLPLLIGGLLLGVGWRIVTAGVIGANIGASLTIFLAGPVIAALVAGALIRGLWLRFAREPV
ncbi:hypothetical protein AB0M57_22630 [Streptomyces sp. NPDC051597]|uniref:hypothetical protein n=1 Tax=Streptomyces sp. NPDC051597 TaxID=3155049 RepID=UPI00342804C7